MRALEKDHAVVYRRLMVKLKAPRHTSTRRCHFTNGLLARTVRSVGARARVKLRESSRALAQPDFDLRQSVDVFDGVVHTVLESHYKNRQNVHLTVQAVDPDQRVGRLVRRLMPGDTIIVPEDLDRFRVTKGTGRLVADLLSVCTGRRRAQGFEGSVMLLHSRSAHVRIRGYHD